MEKVKKNKLFFHDLSWYMVGAMIPMLLNLIKTPILTRHYTTDDFGYLGLMMTTFGYLSTISFSWLASCIWRYYNEFSKRIGLNILFSNILFLFVVSSVLLLVLSLILGLVFHYQEMDYLLIKLTFIAFLHFITKELLALYLVIIRIKGFAKMYNFLLIFQVALAFVLLMLFAFVLHMDITSILLSSFLVDLALIVFIGIKLVDKEKLKTLSLRFVSRRIIKILFGYGSLTLIAALFIMLIVSSDRYIIAMYDTISNVGIYTKVYDISQLSIMAIVFVFFSTINPRMIKELTYNFKNSDQLLVKYLYTFFLLGIPMTTLASIYSREIIQILLGEDFWAGYVIMPSVFFSAFIYGAVKFYENKLKFANKTAWIVRILGISFVLNLIMNFLLVPTYGYVVAAHTTLLTYIFMISCFLWNDSMSIFKNKAYLNDLIKVCLLMVAFWIIDLTIRERIDFGFFHAVVEALVFVGIYILLFYKKIKKIHLPV